MKSPAALYVFEGPDSVGKTTLSKWFANTLRNQGRRPVIWSSFPGKEKGSVGYLVYRLHHNSTGLGVKTIHPRSLQLYHIAAHIDSIESRFARLIESGTTIVLDRFWWSTWVYGRFAGEKTATLEEMINLEKCAWGKIKPAKIFLVSSHNSKDTKKHIRLTQLYAQLARKETSMVCVEFIQSNGDLDGAKNQILSSLW